MKQSEDLRKFKAEIRKVLANYMRTEGCSCCENFQHAKYKEQLGKLLNIRKYPDGSGYDFEKYRTID